MRTLAFCLGIPFVRESAVALWLLILVAEVDKSVAGDVR